jgi:hypothetical protein
MCVTDVARQHAQIPGRLQREEEVSLRAAGVKRGDAAVSRLKKLACIAECMSKRFVRLPRVFQVSSEAVEECERGEFPLQRQHGAVSFQKSI